MSVRACSRATVPDADFVSRAPSQAHHVGLGPRLLTVPKTAPSAKNRYLFYPDRLALLPSSLSSAFKAIFTNPVIRSAMPGILLEPFRPKSPLHALPPTTTLTTDATATTTASAFADESVDSFFRRRFGAPLADNMISAMIHGIYSGDTRELSVRAVFPGLWEAEREWGSVVLAGLFGGVWRRWMGGEKSLYRRRVEEDKVEEDMIKERLREGGQEGLVEAMEGASVWGVEGGLEELTKGVEKWLRAEGVEFRLGDEGKVESVKIEDGKIEVSRVLHVSDRLITRRADPPASTPISPQLRTPTSTLHPTHLITTLPSLLPPPLTPSPIPASTVAVINLAFPRTASSPSAPLFPPGFGYLLPRSVPPSHNPHSVLGVLFDSDVMPAVDASAPLGITKASVLLGGSYWRPSAGGPPSPLPQEHELVQQALATLRLHFPEREIPDPFHARARVHVDCIPQVPPGHTDKFRADGARLRAFMEREGVRVAVAGGGVAVVGVNGAVRAGQEVGEGWAREVNGEVRGEEARIKTGFENWE